jgi:hypothetical protein
MALLPLNTVPLQHGVQAFEGQGTQDTPEDCVQTPNCAHRDAPLECSRHEPVHVPVPMALAPPPASLPANLALGCCWQRYTCILPCLPA